MLCLFLFLIPVLAFESLARKKDSTSKKPKGEANPMSKRLQAAAYCNLKWTCVSSASTLLFFSTAHTLQWEYYTIWSILGAIDVCVKAYTIMKISMVSSSEANKVTPQTGTRYLESESVIASSIMTKAPVEQGIGLFESSVAQTDG
jgi:hypothetical protein